MCGLRNFQSWMKIRSARQKLFQDTGVFAKQPDVFGLNQGVRHSGQKSQKYQNYHSFFHLFHDFSTLVLLASVFTPVGVGPDHVIKGANQRTLAAGNGERVRVDGWDRQKKVCKFWSLFNTTSVLPCHSTVSKVPKVPSLEFWRFWHFGTFGSVTHPGLNVFGSAVFTCNWDTIICILIPKGSCSFDVHLYPYS